MKFLSFKSLTLVISLISKLNLINQNITQRHKARLYKKVKISFEQLLEIGQISLNIIEFRSKRIRIFADLNKSNIIEKKRTRCLNSKYVITAWTNFIETKKSKFFNINAVLYVVFIIEINCTASRIQEIYINNLLKLSAN